ncbi:hypothetical protein IQ250_23185 [Pseudanabaenaceae cyanobacterium LEGE 13415]|nr:hypothetical protein [Pseudanabaenaceae cyanobacterium LEGE 13415]
MAIPKKGTRKILIEEEPFIWLVRRQGTNCQLDYPEGCLHVAVEHSQEPGSTLVIITDRLHPKGYSLVQSWHLERSDTVTPVTPSDIASWVQQALQMGWQPKQSGQPFIVRVVDKSLEKMK